MGRSVVQRQQQPARITIKQNHLLIVALVACVVILALFQYLFTTFNQLPSAMRSAEASADQTTAASFTSAFPPYDDRFLFDGPFLRMHAWVGPQKRQNAINKIAGAEGTSSVRDAHREYADLLLDEGETDAAMAEYQKAYAMLGEQGRSKTKPLGDFYSSKVVIGLADALMDKGDFARASDYYLHALNYIGSDKHSLETGNLLFKLGVCKAGLGDTAAANQYMEQCLECLKPLESASEGRALRISALTLAGDSLLMLRRFRDASARFEQAIEIIEDAANEGAVFDGTKLAVIRMKSAQSSYLAGDPAKAERSLQKVLEECDVPQLNEAKVRALYAFGANFSGAPAQESVRRLERALAEAKRLGMTDAILGVIERQLAKNLPPGSPRAATLAADSQAIFARRPLWSPRPVSVEETVDR